MTLGRVLFHSQLSQWNLPSALHEWASAGQGNAALCALEMAQSSRGDHESTQHCWENSAKCCENTAGNNKPSGVKVQLHRNNVQNFCNLAVENGSDRPFPGN